MIDAPEVDLAYQAAKSAPQQAETMRTEHWRAVGRAKAFRRMLAARAVETQLTAYVEGHDDGNDDWPELRG
jgi:hypothetical protein